MQQRYRGFDIGKYRILELLGAGGMGKVFLCEHTLLKKPVAVKMLTVTKTADPGSLQRFVREARASLALSHPNIVRAFDLDQDRGLYFLVMEFVEGLNLHDLVKRRGPLSVGEVANVIAQAANGLQHAHESGWVHRDIKPANLLLDRSGVLKMLDMGLARLRTGAGDDLTKKYNSQHILGTADYLPPEQALNSTDVDIRADIYSLGVTGYFLLTGQTPFGDGTTAQKLMSHQMRTAVPVAKAKHGVPTKFSDVIARMMSKRPKDRYQSPVEVAAAIVPWIDDTLRAPKPEELPRWCPAVRTFLNQSSESGASAGETAPGNGSGTLPTTGNKSMLKATITAAQSKLSGTTKSASRRLKPLPRRQRTGARIALAGGAVVVAVLAVGFAMSFVKTGTTPSTNSDVARVNSPDGISAVPEETIQPAAASQYVGRMVQVEMEVKITGRNKTNSLAFLNSEIDFRSEKCFTVVINKQMEQEMISAGYEDILSELQGKTIRVLGTITLYQNRPQIVLADSSKLEIIPDEQK